MHAFFRGVGHKLTAKNTQDAIKESNLDWEVFKAHLQTVEHFDSKPIQLTKQMGIFRKDTNFPLGVVGSGYGIIQNNEAANILDEVIEQAPGGSPIVIRHGAALFGGDKIFLTAEVGNPILIGTESFIRFIVLSWGHNGGVALKVSFMLCRISTGTIINVKMKGVQSDVKIRHTRNANERLKIAGKVIKNAFFYFEKITEKFSLLADSLLTDMEFDNLLKTIIPVSEDASNRAQTIAENRHQEALETYKIEPNYGTKLGGFLAISEWNANKRTAVRESKEKFGKSEVEVNGTLFGNRNKEMRNAFIRLLETVNELATV